MIDKAKVVEAIKSMKEKGDWGIVLKNAPGAAALRVALAFYASKNLDSMSSSEKDEYREFRETLEQQLNAEELKYLTEAFGYMGVQAAQEHYKELFDKKPPEEQQQGTLAYNEIAKRLGWEGQGSQQGDNQAAQASQTEQTATTEESANANGQEG